MAISADTLTVPFLVDSRTGPWNDRGRYTVTPPLRDSARTVKGCEMGERSS